MRGRETRGLKEHAKVNRNPAGAKRGRPIGPMHPDYLVKDWYCDACGHSVSTGDRCKHCGQSEEEKYASTK